MGLAFVPFYIKLMGVESYGIVGVFTSLMGMLSILDLGLSTSMNREMARLSIDKCNSNRMADTARTLEVIYWVIALGVATVIALLANFIAYHWLNPEHLSREALLQALWIMALVIGLRWPVAIYMGGLNGLQKQVTVNVLQAIFATLQGAGALAVLWFIKPTIQVFFIWQAIIALMQVVALRVALWRSLDNEHKGAFNKEVLHDIWRFAAGMTGISLVATILTQLDKVLLSKLLSLTDFGYYTFATTLAAVIYRITGPIFIAYYPRLTELVSKGDSEGVVEVYHQGCQLMAVAILPVTFVLFFFPKEILMLWTRNPSMAEHSSMLISLLIIGNALNGLLHIPYALQLAYGWTKLAFYQNIIAVIVLVPAIYFGTLHWGAVGAAAVWVVLNIGYMLISIQLMYRRLLVTEKNSWYLNDVAKPLIAALLVSGSARTLPVQGLGNIGQISTIAATLGIVILAVIISTNTLRTRVLSRLHLRHWKRIN